MCVCVCTSRWQLETVTECIHQSLLTFDYTCSACLPTLATRACVCVCVLTSGCFEDGRKFITELEETQTRTGGAVLEVFWLLVVVQHLHLLPRAWTLRCDTGTSHLQRLLTVAAAAATYM